MKGSSPMRSDQKIKTYQTPNYNNIQSTYAQENISDEDQPKAQKIAEGLGRIKESYNDIKSIYAQDSNASPK